MRSWSQYQMGYAVPSTVVSRKRVERTIYLVMTMTTSAVSTFGSAKMDQDYTKKQLTN